MEIGYSTLEDILDYFCSFSFVRFSDRLLQKGRDVPAKRSKTVFLLYVVTFMILICVLIQLNGSSIFAPWSGNERVECRKHLPEWFINLPSWDIYSSDILRSSFCLSSAFWWFDFYNTRQDKKRKNDGYQYTWDTNRFQSIKLSILLQLPF